MTAARCVSESVARNALAAATTFGVRLEAPATGLALATGEARGDGLAALDGLAATTAAAGDALAAGDAAGLPATAALAAGAGETTDADAELVGAGGALVGGAAPPEHPTTKTVLMT